MTYHIICLFLYIDKLQQSNNEIDTLRSTINDLEQQLSEAQHDTRAGM